MKRHPSLRAFSDDHHQGLVNARRLRRAASGEGASSADSALDFLCWCRTPAKHSTAPNRSPAPRNRPEQRSTAMNGNRAGCLTCFLAG